MWISFFTAMSLVIGLLALGDASRPGGFVATNLSSVSVEGSGAASAVDPVFQIDADLDIERWRGIVIHHLGAPAGDAESIHRQHRAHGYHGLGYHFLIGNGNGLGDGVVHVGYRWNLQLPGAHTVGPDRDHHNQHAIGICLIGHGDRRPFTERQIRHLVILVRRLQRELRIPRHAVRLHRDVTSLVTSPGKLFPAATLEQQLLDIPR